MDTQSKPTQTQPNMEPIIHRFDEKTHALPLAAIILCVGVILLGGATGYLLSTAFTHSSTTTTLTAGDGQVTKGTVVGSADTKTFKDTATGTLTAGGIKGEGQFHLVRPGGDSQNVYLTSSIVDLSQFVGKKITVRGQTVAAQYAGWLMDVGQVTVE